MNVRDVMTANIATAEPDTTLEEIATIMRDADAGAVPVIDGDELVGLVTDRDIVIRCVAAGKAPSEVVAEEVMSDDLETIDADSDLDEAAQFMSEKQVRRLPVVEFGRFVGMLSLGDLAVKQRERPREQSRKQSKDKAGSALKQISRGVKTSEGGRKNQGGAGSEAKAGGRKKAQGIGNRDLGEEEERQSRVIPFRKQGKRTPRRKTG